jgi:hypothetical protein
LASDDIQTLLRTAIQTAQSGNKPIARSILQQVIDLDADNELAWIWMATVAETTAERRQCLQRVLEINPNNERARQALARLQSASATPTPSRPQQEGSGVPPASRLTPRLTQQPLVRASRGTRAAEMEREAVLRARIRRSQRRSISPFVFITVGLLAVAMITLGLLLLLVELQPEDNTSASTSTAQALRPTSAQVAGFASSTPVGGTLRTLSPRETLPATWTPQPTGTPSATPTVTATPIPLSDFALLVSQKTAPEKRWRLNTLQADGSGQNPIDLVTVDSDFDAGVEIEILDVFDAVYSPDNDRIAFTARLRETHTENDEPVTTEYTELFVAPAEGGTSQRITRFEAPNLEDATWSSDGTEIAFSSDVDGDYEVYIATLDGGTPRPLTNNEFEDRDPAWSPDGRYIAFASDRTGPGFLEIWRVTPTGADLKQLTDNVNSSFAPAWSPDGESIVFLSNRRVNTDLYVMDWQGNGERALIVRDADNEERDPAWSPDGNWIVFSSNRESAILELYLIRPDGSGLQRITYGDGDIRFADWQHMIM